MSGEKERQPVTGPLFQRQTDPLLIPVFRAKWFLLIQRNACSLWTATFKKEKWSSESVINFSRNKAPISQAQPHDKTPLWRNERPGKVVAHAVDPSWWNKETLRQGRNSPFKFSFCDLCEPKLRPSRDKPGLHSSNSRAFGAHLDSLSQYQPW